MRGFPYATVAIALLAGTQLGADGCDGEIIDDRGFDLWCGPQLCAWETERGTIRPAPTWHRGDQGVELLGPDTAISQSQDVDQLDGSCIRFTMLADVALTTDVALELDILADGTVDHVERVAGAHFAPIEFRLGLATPYRGLVFRLVKQGDGRAVLANIGAAFDTGCSGDPIEATPPTDARRGTVSDVGASP
jgi:hypothetical protein